MNLQIHIDGDDTMTVLLMLFTLIVFLTADYFVQRSRAAGARAAAHAWGVRIPEDVELATNHMWLTGTRNEVATIGMDELLGGLVGVVNTIVLPRVGAKVTTADAISLQAGEKFLEVAVPIQGEVVAINDAVVHNTRLAVEDPYGAGWLVKIRPETHVVRQSTIMGTRAKDWLRTQADLMKEFLLGCDTQVKLVTMQDGGMPVEGVLKQYDQKVWLEFQRTFIVLRTELQMTGGRN
jgi:glycine cleavage system H protein